MFGQPDPGRAYSTNDFDGKTYPYYEWQWLDDSKTTKEVHYFNDYDYKDGKWRGVDPVGPTEYFNASDGKKVQNN